jgi:hypothetical protein
MAPSGAFPVVLSQNGGQIGTMFGCVRLSLLRGAHLGARLWRVLRTCGKAHEVVAIRLVAGAQSLHPGVFPCNQIGSVRHVFEHAKREAVRAVQVVGGLQMGVVMPVRPQIRHMAPLPFRKVNRTAHVNLAVGGVGDGVDAHPLVHAHSIPQYGPQSLYHLEPTTEDAVQAFYTPRPRLALAQARAIISEEELAAHDMATDGYGADGWPDPDAMEDPSPVEPDDPENDDTALMEG